jgi:hypothetical protein
MSTKELEDLKKQLADAENAKAAAEARALSAERAAGIPTVAAKGPVTPEKIRDTKVRALHSKAKANAEKYIDHPVGRRELAAKCQDVLVALRDLDIRFAHDEVSLFPGGDLYVGPQGVHPLNVGNVLEERMDVARLAELSDKLNAALEYETT